MRQTGMHAGSGGRRSFCQKLPSPATSKPIMSLTAIIGALTAALPVMMQAHRRRRVRQGVEVGELDRQPEAVAPVLGVHDGQHLPGLRRARPAPAAARCRRRAGPTGRAPPPRSASRRPAPPRRSSFSRPASASHTSSSWPSSPCGSSVDMHRKSSHWSSTYSAGHGASKVERAVVGGIAGAARRSARSSSSRPASDRDARGGGCSRAAWRVEARPSARTTARDGRRARRAGTSTMELRTLPPVGPCQLGHARRRWPSRRRGAGGPGGPPR